LVNLIIASRRHAVRRPGLSCPFGDADAVEKQLEICDKIGIGVAAVLMEPIQGEAGGIVPPDDFWPRIARRPKNTEPC
jgi:acetylornithine/succinyldiaminopimelate/putrescine aminotransferase